MKDNYSNIEKTLSQISKVTPPPFLFTRIEAQIETKYAPSNLSFAGLSIAVSCVIIVLNAWIMFGSNTYNNQNNEKEPLSEYASSIGLNESNQLYYD